jgi:hypothetical protein
MMHPTSSIDANSIGADSIDVQAGPNILEIEEPTIWEYFEKLNQGEFIATAALFSEQGCLNPPFEKPIQGRIAIAQYLQSEASGMRFCPEYGEMLSGNQQQPKYHIQGNVVTPWFTVKVTWMIKLNAAREIINIDIKLLAALNDLLALKRD